MKKTVFAYPERLFENRYCLIEVSEDLKGEFRLLDKHVVRCKGRRCAGLRTEHNLDVTVKSHDPCDRTNGRLDGRLLIRDLVTSHVNTDGHSRAAHVARFRWRTRIGVTIAGKLQGMTNMGTHRRPVFDSREPCDAKGIMEGVMCGRVIDGGRTPYAGLQLQASYRLRFDPTSSGADGATRGTLEGVLLLPCKDRPQTGQACVDFSAMAPGSGPNPQSHHGASFLVHDHTGAPTADSQIQTTSGYTGLNGGYKLAIKLPVQCSEVRARLVRFNPAGATMTAFEKGSAVDSDTMMTDIDTLNVNGGAIDYVEIKAGQNEVLLLELCWTPA